MNKTKIAPEIIYTYLDYDINEVFVTPDRMCENFLYNHGFEPLDTFKDETGWTYWVFKRDGAFEQVLRDFKVRLNERKEVAKKLKQMKNMTSL